MPKVIKLHSMFEFYLQKALNRWCVLQQHMVMQRVDVPFEKVPTTPNSLMVFSILYEIGSDSTALGSIAETLKEIVVPGWILKF